MENKELFELADQLKAAKDRKKKLDALTKENNAEIERLDLTLSEGMAEVECDRFSRNGYTFYLGSRLFASPAAGRKEDMMHALKDNGYGSLVVETVNAGTLSSFCKEQMAANDDELPDWLSDVVTTFEKVSVDVRKD